MSLYCCYCQVELDIKQLYVMRWRGSIGVSCIGVMHGVKCGHHTDSGLTIINLKIILQLTWPPSANWRLYFNDDALCEASCVYIVYITSYVPYTYTCIDKIKHVHGWKHISYSPYGEYTGASFHA